MGVTWSGGLEGRHLDMAALGSGCLLNRGRPQSRRCTRRRGGESLNERREEEKKGLLKGPVSNGSSHLLALLSVGRGLNRSGVDLPLSSSRACLTTFIANSVP